MREHAMEPADSFTLRAGRNVLGPIRYTALANASRARLGAGGPILANAAPGTGFRTVAFRASAVAEILPVGMFRLVYALPRL